MNDRFDEGCLEEAYPLSPLQQGMLFHSLYSRACGVDIEQLLMELPEEVNVPAFQRAWHRVTERHPILRTSFHWEGLDQPHQQVNRNVRIHWELKDWRGLSVSEQKHRLEAYLQADRRRGFDLTLAPLMRFALTRAGPAKYWLVWTFHHLIMDGRSLVVLINELFAFYDALNSGYELELKVPVPYREYIRWLQQQDPARAETFWRHYLDGFATPTVLPVGTGATSAPLDTTSEPADQQTHLSPTFTTTLRSLAERYELTLNTLLQGAWALLLSRYSGQSDVAYGTIRACRHGTAPGADDIVGPVINTVPMRVRVRTESNLIDWLKELRGQWIALRPYEHTPLLQVQECSAVPRGQPLFETLLNVQVPSWDAALRSQGGRWRRRRFSVKSQPNYPLVADVYVGRGLVVKVWYNRRRFEDEWIGRLLEQMKRVLEGMVENPQQRVAQLPWVSPVERHQVLVEWNRTEAENHLAACVPKLIEEQAAQRPKALAVACGDEQVNYAELNRRAHRVGRQLRKLGVGPEQLVGVCLDRSVRLVVAMLSVWKAGGAYVPLDSSYPEERLQFMVEDAAMRVVLTERKFLERLAVKGTQIVCLEELEAKEPANEKEPDPAWQYSARPDHLAYVIYTSGSTGRPKGVEIQHGSLMNLVEWHQRTYQVSPLDRATQIAGTAYDACVWEVWPYLAMGASLFIADESTRVSARGLVQWIDKYRITVCFLPTPLAHAVMDEPWPSRIALRALLTGGEKLHRRPGQNFPCELINHYGPTENTVVTTCAAVAPEFRSSQPIPIGRPIANTQTYILDPQLEPVPVGVPGELYLAGKSLARGYRRQPALTAERLVPNPFSNDPGERLYRTGDLVRHLPDGNIEFLGRIDQQVKVRGHRVELGEIESVLNQHPDVREATVVLQQDGHRENRLAAFVVPKCQRQVTGPQLREFLKKQLPEHMIPSGFAFLGALPLTSNGKVNRQALPSLKREFGLETEAVSPRTPTEEALAAIWEEVLAVKRVGIHDNFFDLGGHSMLATQVVSRVYRLFQCELPVRELFEFPTVAALAERIDLANRGSPEAPPPPLAPRDHDAHRPLSFAQERLWFLEQLEPNQAFNNIPVGVKLEGRLQLEALEESLAEISRRHESLRTSFQTIHGQPAVQVASEASLPFSIVDLSHLPSGTQPEELTRLSAEEARRPFDLSAGPLWRAKLFRLAADEHFLALTMHHIISDGWSLGLLFRELKALYEGALAGHPVSLPELPIQYSDFAAWQREWMQGETLEKQLSFWKRQLSGSPPTLNLPTDRPRPPVQLYRGSKVFFALPTSLSKALRHLSLSEDVTQYMLLLAALQTLLGRYSGQEDITVGSPIAGRRRVETEGLIGFFANTLVLRGDLSGDPTFRELLRRIRRVALDAYAHQDLPFEKLVDASQPERSLSHSPLFQVMFIYQRSPTGSMEMGGLKLTQKILDSGTSKFDLTLSLEESADDLSGFLEFDTALFDPSTITRFLAHYQTLLESIVDNADRRLSRLPFLSPDEKEQMLVQWNATRTRYDENTPVHELIAGQAGRAPEAVAVAFEGEQLTYEELNARAEQFARHLRAEGIAPAVLVGLFMEPSLEMIVALLATLKAGGAYVPLDPTYPRERLTFMLADSNPLVVLTQKKLLSELPPFGGTVICLDQSLARGTRGGGWSKSAEGSRSSLRQVRPEVRSVQPEDLAYVIYTSGSTGKPKGVCVTHRGVTNFLHSMLEKLGVSAGDVLLSVTTLSFDIAALEIYLPLVAGAQLVLASRETATDGALLAKKISESRATFMQGTPATWRLLLESGWEGSSSLRILCGGESLPRPLANALLQRGASLWNLYGPTETTIWSAAHQVEPGEGLVPIGRPIANTQIYILDEQAQPVPVGVPGELYIGGDGVARGYWNRPELTAERFMPDGFPGGKPVRLYRTGDLGRFLADGRIEFLGRVDHQVKLRGHRIELSEIEAAIAEHPAVCQAVVVLHHSDPDNDRLVAHVTRRARSSVSFDELSDFLREKLPGYMIPSHFVLRDDFPLTPNGKVDRRALSEARLTPQLAEGRFTAPKTPLEKVLAEIWAKLFGLERVGLENNFFKLGGHSLLAVQLIARIRSAFKIDLPLRILFEAPTIERLAQAMVQRDSTPGQVEKLAKLIIQVKGMTAKEVRKVRRKESLHRLWTETASQT